MSWLGHLWNNNMQPCKYTNKEADMAEISTYIWYFFKHLT